MALRLQYQEMEGQRPDLYAVLVRDIPPQGGRALPRETVNSLFERAHGKAYDRAVLVPPLKKVRPSCSAVLVLGHSADDDEVTVCSLITLMKAYFVTWLFAQFSPENAD